VVVHEVLADEATGYVRYDEVLGGDLVRARDIGLWLTPEGSTTSFAQVRVGLTRCGGGSGGA
jgi:hypothetical protein